MKRKIAKVKNFVNWTSTLTQLINRDAGIPGLGLIHGFTGAGKTTTVIASVNRFNGIYLRATSVCTPTSQYRTLLRQLGIAPLSSAAKMLDAAVEYLLENPRPIFVDEADYLIKSAKLLDSWRDLHDLTSVPIVLIGMEGIAGKLVHRKQLSRRISQWLEFQPCDLADARLLTETCCEIEIHDDLLAHLHKQAKGSIGQMVVGLSRLESHARTHRLKSLKLATWQESNKKLFLGRAA